jgi:hypothetical protein
MLDCNVEKEPVAALCQIDYVDPMIGTDGMGHTFRVQQLRLGWCS